MKPNQTIVLYQNDDVEIGRYKNILEAYKGLKEIKEADKRYAKEFNCPYIIGFNEYYFELEEETEKTITIYPIKIYKRKNKIYMKGTK